MAAVAVIAVIFMASGNDDPQDKNPAPQTSTSGSPEPSFSLPTRLPSELPSELPSQFPSELPSEFPSDLESLLPSFG
ncbi:hypothetical protein AQI84_20975 [Streptomyces griseorubiginosus]|uniref:Uncharacterized protein n=1 Tax=Streptomyces griseorubiginosus TaxID=67304 RepID=A0A117P8R0_9ACTN|nr:hypothetical protein AQI84_20975 [Streptomyces griseorubiginosus]KUN64183.1 hypothetical protein AQJ54_24425 [Streptomyces griseorubiginosus]